MIVKTGATNEPSIEWADTDRFVRELQSSIRVSPEHTHVFTTQDGGIAYSEYWPNLKTWDIYILMS